MISIFYFYFYLFILCNSDPLVTTPNFLSAERAQLYTSRPSITCTRQSAGSVVHYTIQLHTSTQHCYYYYYYYYYYHRFLLTKFTRQLHGPVFHPLDFWKLHQFICYGSLVRQQNKDIKMVRQFLAWPTLLMWITHGSGFWLKEVRYFLFTSLSYYLHRFTT